MSFRRTRGPPGAPATIKTKSRVFVEDIPYMVRWGKVEALRDRLRDGGSYVLTDEIMESLCAPPIEKCLGGELEVAAREDFRELPVYDPNRFSRKVDCAILLVSLCELDAKRDDAQIQKLGAMCRVGGGVRLLDAMLEIGINATAIARGVCDSISVNPTTYKPEHSDTQAVLFVLLCNNVSIDAINHNETRTRAKEIYLALQNACELAYRDLMAELATVNNNHHRTRDIFTGPTTVIFLRLMGFVPEDFYVRDQGAYNESVGVIQSRMDRTAASMWFTNNPTLTR